MRRAWDYVLYGLLWVVVLLFGGLARIWGPLGLPAALLLIWLMYREK